MVYHKKDIHRMSFFYGIFGCRNFGVLNINILIEHT